MACCLLVSGWLSGLAVWSTQWHWGLDKMAAIVPGAFSNAWISNYIHNKVWGEIIYPFPNLLDFWERMSNSPPTLVDMRLLIHAWIKVKPF